MLNPIVLAYAKITAKVNEVNEVNAEKAKDAFLKKALSILESKNPDRFSRFICRPATDGNCATCILADWARPGREYILDIIDDDVLIDGDYHVAWLRYRNRLFNLIEKEEPYWANVKKKEEVPLVEGDIQLAAEE